MASWRLFAGTGGLFGALGVGAGAFGAHALRGVVTPASLETWKTAVLYQLLHSLLLVVIALWCRRSVSAHIPDGSLVLAGWAVTVGIVLFSGSLYALALGGPALLGPITPIGGIAFILGWLSLGAAALKDGLPR